jgi:hypothetical protein
MSTSRGECLSHFADGATLDGLSTVNFQVNVTGQSTVSEPESALLLATGGIAIAVRDRMVLCPVKEGDSE